MAKDPKTIPTGDDQLTLDPGAVTAELTYHPGDGDPPSVKWGPHTFHANIAKAITGRDGGTERETLNHHIIQRARDNPHFSVDGQRSKRGKIGTPKDADEYKRYFVGWLKNETFDCVDDLLDRFVRDRNLQISAELAPEDFAWMRDLFNPRLHDLAKADGITEPQIAAAWAARGVNVLPW
ncbi:hypothetical protein ACRAVF_27255 [Bradyrhizobium oligotrophicum S58]